MADDDNELQATGELNRICDCLEEMSGELYWATIQILSSTEKGQLANTFAGPAMYSSKQGKRIAAVLRDGNLENMDLVAWSARCLFETQLFISIVLMQEHDDAAAMIQKWVEHGYSKVDFSMQLIENHTEEAREVLTQELKSLGRGPNQFERAEQSGEADEYRQFYGFLCEYTHPSSYLLCGVPEQVYNATIAREFGRRAVYYLQKIIECFHYIRNYGLPL